MYLSMACMQAGGGLIKRDIRSGASERQLALPKEISHEHIDHISDRAIVERSGIG
jgi:hypothetical protein